MSSASSPFSSPVYRPEIVKNGPKKQINGVLLYTSLDGLFLTAHGLRPSFMLVAVVGFVLFMTLPMIDASNTSIWQSKVPTHLQGRCFAMQQFLLNVAMAVGYCLAGPLSDHVQTAAQQSRPARRFGRSNHWGWARAGNWTDVHLLWDIHDIGRNRGILRTRCSKDR